MTIARRLPTLVAAALLAASVGPPRPAIAQAQAHDGSATVRALFAALVAAAERVKTSGARASAAEVRTIYRAYFDHGAISATILGRLNHIEPGIDEEELRRLLEHHLVATIAARLPHFAGAALETSFSSPDGEGVLVESRAMGAGGNRRIDIRWRIAKSADGGFRVRDVIVEGLSLALAQKRDIAAAAARHGHGPSAIAAALRDRMRHLQ